MNRNAGIQQALALYGVKLADVETALKDHQQRVVDRLLQPDQPGLVAMHGLGSGKTLTSIAAADALKMPADVVVPAALRANYQKELEKHAPTNTPETHIQSLENVARNQTHLHNPFLIVDEAHRSRNPSKTQQALKNNEAKKRLLLTGSLFYNQPSDAAAPINLVAGGSVLPADPDEFRRFFVSEREEKPSLIGSMLGQQPKMVYDVNPDSKKYLQSVLRKYVDYHPGSTDDFPARTDQTIGVPMTSRQKEIYDALMGKAPKWVYDRVRTGLPPRKSEMAQLNRFLQGTRQVSNSTAPYHLDRPSEQPKIDRAADELKQLLDKNPRAKAIIYSNYLDAGINPYKAKLDQFQIPYGEFTGAMPKARRDQMVRDYNENKLRALLLSRAGGEGLDLKGTRLIQLLEPHWNEEALKQVTGRGIRYRSHADLPEEERNVSVQHFVTQNPRRGIAERLHLKDPERSVDQYLLGLAQQKEELNQKFRDLLVEDRMSKNSAYIDGQKAAADMYGVQAPQDQDGYYSQKKKKSWLPAVAAGGLGAFMAYKHMRTPNFSSNPGLRAVQEQAAAKGFHRVHDVSPKGDITTGYAPLQSLYQHTLPQVNAKGELNALNKFKLWLHEGNEAIPVARMTPQSQPFIPGAPHGVNAPGVVFDRTALPGSEKLIHGGTDAEGPMHVQQLMSDFGDKGKGFETALLNRHVPDAIPKSFTDIPSIVGQPNAAMSRVDQARAMQKRMMEHLKGQGVEHFAMKPTQGLDSRGQFPSSKDDWGKMIQEFDEHMAVPENAAKLKALREGGDMSALTEHLHENELYSHHALDTALRDPSQVYAQHWMPGAMGEWRVHTVNGAAPTELMMPRNLKDAVKGTLTNANKQHIGPMRDFVENEVLAKLPEDYRRGAYGMDVMPFRMPDGSIKFKVIEMNPHGLSSAQSGGGGSGLLEPDIVPGAGWAHYKAMTGRHAQPVAAAGALATGAVTGGLARALTPEDDDTPHPVG